MNVILAWSLTTLLARSGKPMNGRLAQVIEGAGKRRIFAIGKYMKVFFALYMIGL